MARKSNTQLDDIVTKYRSMRRQNHAVLVKAADIIVDFEERNQSLSKDSLLGQTFGMTRLLVELICREEFYSFGSGEDHDPKRYQSSYIAQQLLELSKKDLAQRKAVDEEDERENG